MKLAKSLFLPSILWAVALAAAAQAVTTTSVQGTVYSASGAPISGTLQLSWPSFTTAASQAIAAGRLAVSIGADGFLSVNLAPNQGALPAGLYYTAIYHLADGTTSTEYWVVPAAAQATLAQVRAQVMPAAQAVQAVNKAYVDQAILQSAQSQISSFGGTLNGPLYLNGDPAVPTQAADKHYVDNLIGQTVPISGGVLTGPVTATQIGAVHQADQSAGTDFGSRLQSCINSLNTTYGGTCDARNFSGALTISAPIAIATANITVQLPCATIATANPIVIAAGTRNVTLHGCATRGSSSASGSQGGTVFLYSGSAAFFQVGDPTYSADTLGFHLDNVVVNTTPATASTAQALAAWRTQELHLESLYLLGNSNQTALTLDGTGNYTGGTFQDIEIGGFLTAVNAIGHQVSNSATTDWLNASTFLRLHIDCPTSSGNPIAGTVGINLQQGDGNTFTGGDVEGCGTALHLGANAQNNTIVGLRNENSTSQVVADTGSSYNNWIAGGTMFSGKLTDNGTRNSFLDTFHRSFNALNGDWYGSQQDATVTNHFRIGIGSGNERGLLNRYQTDYGYRWTTGLSDAAAGEQFYQVLDELNNVYRLSIGQYNNGQSSTNNQTVVNSAGTGAIILNGSNNAGTGGVLIGSGGATSSTVATVDKSGNAQFTGTLQVGGTAQSTGTLTVRNNADAEVDYYLWPGLTASQKGSFTYKDYNGNSQWYMVKDASNNWALNSATSGLDSFKAYQSTNSGDTYVNASNSGGVVRVNYEPGSGSAFNIYGGNSGTLYAGFTGPTSIKLPGLAAASGHNCMQVDNSGYLSNSGQPCGSGTVGAGILGQIAYYTATGAALSGVNAVPLASGGTGASDAPTALANLGAVPASGGVMTGPLTGTSATFATTVAAGSNVKLDSALPVNVRAYGATGDGHTNDTAAINNAISAAIAQARPVYFPASTGCYVTDPITTLRSWMRIYGDGEGFPVSGSGVTGGPVSTICSRTGGDIISFNSGSQYLYGLSIDHLTLEGYSGANTGRGIYISSDGTHVPSNIHLSHIYFQNIGGTCVYIPQGTFTFSVDHVVGSCGQGGSGGNGIDIDASNTSYIGPGTYIYTAGGTDSTGKGNVGTAYRIHAGYVEFDDVNGVNGAAWWGVFGDNAADDGVTSYAHVVFNNCNFEGFSTGGLHFKSGSYLVSLVGGKIEGSSGGGPYYGILDDYAPAPGLLRGTSATLDGAATWVNGYAITSSSPPVIVYGVTSTSTITSYYDSGAAYVESLPVINTNYCAYHTNCVTLNHASLPDVEGFGLNGIAQAYGSAAPTSGAHVLGEIVWNKSPGSGTTNLGWICTTAGTPGTWVAFGYVGNLSVATVVANGTAAMPTAAITAGSYSTAATITTTSGTIANVATTDQVSCSANALPSTTNAPLVPNCIATAGGITIEYFNGTAATITPVAETINWGVTR